VKTLLKRLVTKGRSPTSLVRSAKLSSEEIAERRNGPGGQRALTQRPPSAAVDQARAGGGSLTTFSRCASK
jgi:hypothetical protein